MKTYTFEYTEELQLIVIIASIDNYDVRLALDTGASNTVIDLTELLIAGYRKSDAIGQEDYETGKGNITADTYRIKKMKAFGIERANFVISSYDFLVNNVLSAIHGVLGLDFFKAVNFVLTWINKKSQFTMRRFVNILIEQYTPSVQMPFFAQIQRKTAFFIKAFKADEKLSEQTKNLPKFALGLKPFCKILMRYSLNNNTRRLKNE